MPMHWPGHLPSNCFTHCSRCLTAQSGGPTFPASAKGNALWKAKVSADKYYAADPYPAMLDASKKIFAGEKPVSYDSNSAMEGQFSNELKKSKDAQAALEAFAVYATNLAKQLGYKVSTS